MPDKDDRLIFEAYLEEGIEAPLRNTATKIIEVWNELHGILIPSPDGSGDETTDPEWNVTMTEPPETIGGKEVAASGKYTGNQELAIGDIEFILQGGHMNQNDELKSAHKAKISYVNFLRTLLSTIGNLTSHQDFYHLAPGTTLDQDKKKMYPTPKPEHIHQLNQHIEGLIERENQQAQRTQAQQQAVEPEEPGSVSTLPQWGDDDDDDDGGNGNVGTLDRPEGEDEVPTTLKFTWESLIQALNRGTIGGEGGNWAIVGRPEDMSPDSDDSSLEYQYRNPTKDLFMRLKITAEDIYFTCFSLKNIESSEGVTSLQYPALGQAPMNLTKRMVDKLGGDPTSDRVVNQLNILIDSWEVDDSRLE